MQLLLAFLAENYFIKFDMLTYNIISVCSGYILYKIQFIKLLIALKVLSIFITSSILIVYLIMLDIFH